jgi:hypothetical protein
MARAFSRRSGRADDPRPSRPPKGSPSAVLVTTAEAVFEILEGEPLLLVTNLQAKRVLAHAPLQQRLGLGLLASPADWRFRLPST